MSSSTNYAPVARLLNNEEEQITYNVKPEYAANIPEALNLSWEDDFFANDDDVIAVFDLDYELMRSFYEQMGWCTYFSSILIPPAFILATVPGLIPVFLKRNVAWNVNAQHVAVTRDGIRFVRDFRKSCWGLNCTDQGKNSKTVPFDKITDCDVQEPGGNSCIVIKNVLSTVIIDTASSGSGADGVIRHELQISGLKDPYAFKKLVWAMKRLRTDSPALVAGTAAGGVAPTSLEMAGRGGNSDSDVSLLLKEIRDELRSHNTLLQKIQEQKQPTASGKSDNGNDVQVVCELPKDV